MDKFVSQIWLISQAQQMAPLVPKMQAITIQAFGCKNKQSWLISKTWHLDYFSYQGMANKQYARPYEPDNKQNLALRNFLLIFKGGQILLATRQLRP